MFQRAINLIIIFTFVCSLFPSFIQAQVETHGNAFLPAPGTMVGLSRAFQPVMIRGLTVHKDNPFLFDFIVDTGDVGEGLAPAQNNRATARVAPTDLKFESQKLIKYFLASLTIPEKDLWVNLSPYEKDRVIPQALGQTDMGRDLLAQDYILKQITASLIYPEKGLGKEFWNRVYAKAQELYGHSVDVPVNTFNKVWIMADKASVFERNQTVFVVDYHLKVMLEEDYLALSKHVVGAGLAPAQNIRATARVAPTDARQSTSQIIRDLILPELEREVNQGKNFANLRQIFNAIILSSWYKKNLKQALLTQVYADKEKVKGIDLEDKNIKQKIYEQYLKAYKKGVFNYIKEEPFPRKYFSGGVVPGAADHAAIAVESEAMAAFVRWGSRNLAKVRWKAGVRAREISVRKKEPVIADTDLLGAMYNKIFVKRRMLEANLEDFIGRVTSDEVLLGPENILRRALTLLFSLQIALNNRVQTEQELADENVVDLTISRDNINLINQYLPRVQEAMDHVKLFADYKQIASDRIDQFLAKTDNEFYREILNNSQRRQMTEKYLVSSKGQGSDWVQERAEALEALSGRGWQTKEYYQRMLQAITDAAMTAFDKIQVTFNEDGKNVGHNLGDVMRVVDVLSAVLNGESLTSEQTNLLEENTESAFSLHFKSRKLNILYTQIKGKVDLNLSDKDQQGALQDLTGNPGALIHLKVNPITIEAAGKIYEITSIAEAVELARNPPPAVVPAPTPVPVRDEFEGYGFIYSQLRPQGSGGFELRKNVKLLDDDGKLQADVRQGDFIAVVLKENGRILRGHVKKLLPGQIIFVLNDQAHDIALKDIKRLTILNKVWGWDGIDLGHRMEERFSDRRIFSMGGKIVQLFPLTTLGIPLEDRYGNGVFNIKQGGEDVYVGYYGKNIVMYPMDAARNPVENVGGNTKTGVEIGNAEISDTAAETFINIKRLEEQRSSVVPKSFFEALQRSTVTGWVLLPYGKVKQWVGRGSLGYEQYLKHSDRVKGIDAQLALLRNELPPVTVDYIKDQKPRITFYNWKGPNTLQSLRDATGVQDLNFDLVSEEDNSRINVGINAQLPLGGKMRVVSSRGTERFMAYIFKMLETSNAAMNAATRGGIDLQTSNAQWSNQKEGDGVQFDMSATDPAVMEQWRREGIDGLDFKVLSIIPMVSIWPVLGMETPKREEESAGLHYQA